MISTKVMLTGSFGVGKTSLFRQFIFSKFSERYLTTIGVVVNKKEINVDGDSLNILLWDVAGEVSQDKVPHSYLLGTSGIIYVFDLSRPMTFANLESDIAYLRSKVPGVAIKIVGNKSDLVTKEQLLEIEEKLAVPYDIVTSAKTGENVEELFQMLGRKILGKEQLQ
jgi:small GTP-binding protein